MSTQSESYEPRLGRTLLLGAILIALLRELTLPRTVASGVVNIFQLPKDLIMLLVRALMIFKPLFDLLGSVLAIVRAAFLLATFGVVIMRLLDLFGIVRSR